MRYDNGRNDRAMRCDAEKAHDSANCQSDFYFDGKRRQIDLKKKHHRRFGVQFLKFENRSIYDIIIVTESITRPKFLHSQREAMHLAINSVLDSRSATSRFVHSKIR